MRFKIFGRGGYSSGGFNLNGGSVGGPLVLTNNPLEAMHCATKNYIDSKAGNINSESFVSGVFSADRLPLFTGDATKPSGSGVVTINANGVTAGIYPKFTVTSKGTVTSGGSLLESDLPPMSWSKIGSGKPTGLAGYGILDAITPSGGIMTGVLKCNVNPSSSLNVVTKQYVDDTSNANVASVVTGDYVIKPVSMTPNGFLKCNGGEVSKTTYAALYAVIGDTYNIELTIGSGKPWVQQYGFNNQQSADITGWVTGTSLPVTVKNSQVVVTKNRVYLLGGYISGVGSATVYTAPINADGTLGAWVTGTSLPGIVVQSQAITTKNRVYLLGGLGSTMVYTAPINADGTLGTWTTGTSLLTITCWAQAVVTGNRVYILGGVDSGGNATAFVYTAPINADGTLGAWTTSTSLPSAVAYSQAIVTKNRVYLLGGAINGSYSATVYTAPINADGTLGAWTTGTSLPAGIVTSQSVVTKNRVYLFGGINTSYSYLATVYTATINADGTLGAWTTGTSMPGPSSYAQAIVTNSKVYITGGELNANNLATVYAASFSGGLNDYSPYYDGSMMATDLSNFRLPDKSSSELQGTYTYIKT